MEMPAGNLKYCLLTFSNRLDIEITTNMIFLLLLVEMLWEFTCEDSCPITTVIKA